MRKLTWQVNTTRLNAEVKLLGLRQSRPTRLDNSIYASFNPNSIR